MKCNFQATGTLNDKGRELIKCKRCGHVGRMPRSGRPEGNHRDCPSWPLLEDIGEWASILIEATFGIKPCRKCGQRKAALNTAGQKLRDRLNTIWQRIRGIFEAKEL